MCIIYRSYLTFHDDITTWKRFPYHWPFETGIQRKPTDSLTNHVELWCILFADGPKICWKGQFPAIWDAKTLVRCHIDAEKQLIKNYSFVRNMIPVIATTLQWRHDGHDSASNHQPHDCLLNRLFRRRSKKTSKLRVTGLCAGNSPATGEFSAQMASNAENVSIWWRHYRIKALQMGLYSQSGRTSYRRISRIIKAARFGFTVFQSLWNLTGTSAAALPRCLSNFRAIRSL